MAVLNLFFSICFVLLRFVCELLRAFLLPSKTKYIIYIYILCAALADANSTCDNGMTGVQDSDTDVCCPLECGTLCGGEGCGSIPGVDSSQCCAAAIILSSQSCDQTGQAPCIQTTSEFFFICFFFF